MDARGDIHVVGKEYPLKTYNEKISFLRDYYADAKRTAELVDRKNPEVKTTVIIRADKNANYEQLYELMGQVKEAKFKKMQLRAYTKAGG
jgi:biopolymer transport protein ExbD